MKKVTHICTNRANYKILEDKILLLSEKDNYDVHIISSGDGNDSGFLESIGIKHHFIKMGRSINIFKDLISIINMMKLLKKEKFDIVHTHTAKAGIIGRIAAKIVRVPLIIHTCHGLPFYEGQNKLKYNIYKYLEMLGSMFCDYVASQNKEDIKKLESSVKKSKLFYEGNGVNITKIDQANDFISKEDIHLQKEQYNIPNNKKIILIGARYEPVKDHLLLLESLNDLKEKGRNDFYCLFAGTGELEDTLKKKTEELGLSNSVQFIGYQSHMYPWIKMADMVALSSEKEGIPRIIMESMAMKKAIVATNVMGTKELVIDNKTGLLSEYRSATSLGSNIARLLDNDNLRVELGENGRERIIEEYTEQIVVNRMFSLYSS